MYEDPIVEEVRKVREALAAKFNFDIRAMCEDARKRQATSGHPVVSFAEPGKGQKARRKKRVARAKQAP